MLDKRLVRETGTERILFAGVVVAGVAVAVFTVWQARLLSHVIAEAFLEHRSSAQLRSVLLLLLLVILGRALFTGLSDTLAGEMAIRIKDRVRSRLLRKLAELGPARLRSEATGELSTVVVEGVEALDPYFRQYLPQLLLAAAVPLIVLVFVFPRDWLSGLILLLTAPLIPVFMVLIGNLANAVTRKRWQVLQRLGAHFLDVLRRLTTLKILGRSREQIRTIATVSDQFRSSTLAVLRVAFLSALVLELVATISTAIVAVSIGLRLLSARMAFEPALFILILAPEFYQPLRSLGARFHASVEGVSAADRIYQILRLEDSFGPRKSSKIAPPSPPFHLRFDGVTVRFQGEARSALHNVSFEIRPGQQVALIGETGAGKSTVAQLLLRFLEPTEGRITVSGVPLEEIDPEQWRRRLTWVPQAPYLFHTTVAENLRLANPDASDEQLWSALEQAHLAEFVAALPQGLDTSVGEGGARFSTGQAQRLALARAFLRDAPLLVLDEPTSNVDPELEAQLQQSTRELLRGRTALVIAHRLNTVLDADWVVVLERGRVVQQGPPRILAEQSGPFSTLLRAYAEAEL